MHATFDLHFLPPICLFRVWTFWPPACTFRLGIWFLQYKLLVTPFAWAHKSFSTRFWSNLLFGHFGLFPAPFVWPYVTPGKQTFNWTEATYIQSFDWSFDSLQISFLRIQSEPFKASLLEAILRKSHSLTLLVMLLCFQIFT